MSGSCGIDHYNLVSFIFQIRTVLLMHKHLKENRDITHCPSEQRAQGLPTKKDVWILLDQDPTSCLNVPLWVEKTMNLEGDNLWYWKTNILPKRSMWPMQKLWCKVKYTSGITLKVRQTFIFFQILKYNILALHVCRGRKRNMLLLFSFTVYWYCYFLLGHVF